MSSTYDIQGRNCIFQMKIGDVYMDVICAKTFSLNRVYELKETTTVQSGYDKEFRPRKKSYTISFNGVVQVIAEASKPTIKTLFEYGESFLPVFYRIIYEDNSGNVMVIDGQVYLSGAIFNANPINLLDGTVEMTGNGPILVTDVLPDPINITITSTGDSDIDALFQFKLFDSNGDIAFDSGQLDEASGGNLTHPVNVTGQVQSGTYSFFWQATADSIENEFSLDAPPSKTTPFNDGTSNENTFGVQTYDFTANRNVTFALGPAAPPPTCVPPAIPGAPTLPDGQVNVPYAAAIAITGSIPFNLTNVTKPSWMTLTVNDNPGGGGSISISGTPDTSGAGITVSFDVNNACGTTSFSDTIDVAAAPSTDSTIDWEFNSPGDAAGAWLFRIFVNSVQVVSTNQSADGIFTVNEGDFIQVYMSSSHFLYPLKTIIVNNVTDSISMANETTTLTVDFDWTAEASKLYAIMGEVHN